MPEQSPKWILEVQSDGGEDGGDMVRILRLNGSQAELKYIAMSEEEGKYLITALEWMDSFRGGMVSVPTAVCRKPKLKPKPETVVLEFEMEKPKRKPRS
jgi:hypothetical protein